MRGKLSVLLRTGKLEAALARRPARRRSRWNLAALSDAELEALLPLSEKQVAAEAGGTEPEWIPDEISLMERLWAKQAGAGSP